MLQLFAFTLGLPGATPLHWYASAGRLDLVPRAADRMVQRTVSLKGTLFDPTWPYLWLSYQRDLIERV